MGPIEASIRERVIEARRNLARGTNPPIRWSEPLPPKIKRIHVMQRVFQAGEKLNIMSMEEVPVTPSRSTDDIITEVCEKHRVARKDMLSAIRSQFIMPARFEAIYRIREEKSLSWAQIGRIFNRDHTTCLAAWRRHKETLEAGK